MGVERNKGEVCMASREVTGGCDNGLPPFHVLLLSIFKQQHCTPAARVGSGFWWLGVIGSRGSDQEREATRSLSEAPGFFT